MIDFETLDLPEGWGRIVRGRHGLFLVNRHDEYVGRSLEFYGEYSEPETSLLCSLLRPGDVVVEAGANIGAVTVPMARKVGVKGTIFAFEPQRTNFQLLNANVVLNGLINVSARNAGVAADHGIMRVQVFDPAGGGNCGDIRLSDVATEFDEDVAVQTVDALKLSRCRLIKADVQGMEPEVLAGAAETIARCRPALWVENDIREKSPALIRQIRGLGYRLWWHFSPLFVPNNHRGCRENLFDRVVSSNLLCFPAEGRLNVGGEEILDDDFWPLG